MAVRLHDALAPQQGHRRASRCQSGASGVPRIAESKYKRTRLARQNKTARRASHVNETDRTRLARQVKQRTRLARQVKQTDAPRTSSQANGRASHVKRKQQDAPRTSHETDRTRLARQVKQTDAPRTSNRTPGKPRTSIRERTSSHVTAARGHGLHRRLSPSTGLAPSTRHTRGTQPLTIGATS